MSFDPETFLSTSVETAMATEYPVVDEGDYTLIIQKLDAKEVTSQKDGKTYRFLEVGYIIDDQAARDKTGMEKPMTRQSIILDVNDDGTLAASADKNVALGRLRAACGQNDSSRPWTFSMLIGQVVRGNIKHRTADDGRVYAEVKQVTKL